MGIRSIFDYEYGKKFEFILKNEYEYEYEHRYELNKFSGLQSKKFLKTIISN